MRTPRLAGLGLATMATVAFAAAGCDNGGATPSASATASATSSAAPTSSASAAAADPAAVTALSAATAQLGTTSFKIQATSGAGFKLTGGIDAPKGVGTAQLVASGPNAEINVKTLLIDKDLYVQVPGLTKAGTWTHLDVSRLPAGANVGLRPGQIDPVNTANLLSSTTDVRSTGANAYAGTVDLTKAVGLAGISQVTIDSYGTTAKNVPFTAALDAQGRLTDLTIDLPAVGETQAQPIKVVYSDYGSPVDAQRPAAAQITEAQDSIYKAFGG